MCEGVINRTIDEFIEYCLDRYLDEDPLEGYKPTPATFTLSGVAIKAIDKAKDLAKNSEFSLDDVCPLETWSKLSSGERKSLGKTFRQKIEEAKIARWDRRDSGNKAIYVRT